MSKSTVSETMGVHLPREVARLIEARAEAIGHKKSRFAAMVVAWWVAQGAPAVSSVDATMRAQVMDEFMAREQRRKNTGAESPKSKPVPDDSAKNPPADTDAEKLARQLSELLQKPRKNTGLAKAAQSQQAKENLIKALVQILG